MESTRELSQIQQPPFDTAVALYEEAKTLLQTEPERVIALCREALGLLNEKLPEERRLMADLQLLTASACLLRSDYVATIENAARALEYYRKAGDTFSQIRALLEEAFAYQELGDYVTALEQLLHALALAEFHQDQPSIASALNRIGIIHSLRGDFREALAYDERCLTIYHELNDLEGMAKIYNNICIEYRQLGELDRALENGLQSLRFFEAAKNSFGQARIHGNLTRVYLELDQLDEAMIHAQQAHTMAIAGGRREAQLLANLHLGRVYTRMGKMPEALAHLYSALAVAEETGNTRQQAEAHLEISHARKQQGEFERAFFHFEQYHHLHETVFNDESERKFRDLEVLHRTRQARKEAEFYQMRHAELQRQREMDRRYFESLNQLKDELISTASHDLKNPLTGMQLTLELLVRHGHLDDEMGQHQIRKLEESIQKMRRLVISLLDLAKLETGRALELEMVDLYAFLKNATDDSLTLAESKKIDLQLQMKSDNVTIEIDPLRMRQAIDNLLSNAIKYTPSGGQVVVCGDTIGGTAIISVQDTGLGIPDDDLPKIFERFYRVQNPEHAAIEGTGLGLPITRAIVEQHQGTIEVESQDGAGSLFRLLLPIATSHQAPASETR